MLIYNCIQNADILSYILSACFFFSFLSSNFLNVSVYVCLYVFKQFTVFLSLFTLIYPFFNQSNELFIQFPFFFLCSNGKKKSK